MSAGKNLTIFLGIRWYRGAAEELAEKSAALLEKLNQLNLGKEIPLHWNFPNSPYLEKRSGGLDRIITEIKTRISACRDVIIPMGFSGAPHPLLRAEDLENELGYCLSNPGKSGITQQFREHADVIIPYVPDLRRKEAARLYGKNGFKLVGWPFREETGYYDFGPRPFKKSVQVFFYQHISEVKKDRKNLLPRKLGKGVTHLFLLLELHTVPVHLLLEDLIHELQKKYRVVYGSLNEKSLSPSATEPKLGWYDPPLGCNPRARVYLKNATALAAKISPSAIDAQNMLKLISCASLGADREKREPPGASARKSFLSAKAISAHMPGEVTLPGAQFDVRFSGGKMHALLKGTKNYLTDKLPRSALATREKTFNYTTTSVFSFDEERSRGLQEKLLCRLPGPEEECTLIREYYFVEEFPYLLIGMEAAYPDLAALPNITQVTPFELPLLKGKMVEPPSLHVLYCDGTEAEVLLDSCPAVYSVAGSVFCLRIGDCYLVFGPVPHKNPQVQGTQFRMEQVKHDYYLYANFYGSYSADEIPLFSNSREVCSLFLGLKDQLPQKLPFFPQVVLKTIPASRIALGG